MVNRIVGTAGHVDHGKTCLIKALTGVNTDRLKEEQKRGITIELGFAELLYDDEVKIGIIDVPGHERFVKNMLAGIGGIDLVLLVVAADEGVMPQTREHFAILRLLRITKGIIVITKADLADEEWMELIRADIEDLARGTFLEQAPVIEVSSFTGQNIETLKDLIVQEVKDGLPGRNQCGPFRLPVDRVFTMGGFGTVVTGTLVEGSCKVGDEIQLYPSDRVVKIRGLQVHGTMREEARAGQRIAVNLANIKKEEIERGTVLAAPGSMFCSRILDVKLELLEESPWVLKNRSKVHINIGSAEVIAKVVLAQEDGLEPGGSCYGQLRFMEDMAVKRGDRFVIRFFSPVDTIGGGQVLDANPGRRKRRQEEFVNACRNKEPDVPELAVTQMVREAGNQCLTLEHLLLRMNLGREELLPLLKRQVNRKILAEVEPELYIHEDTVLAFREAADGILSEFHSKNPILAGIGKEEMKSRIAAALHLPDSKQADRICRFLVSRAYIREENGLIASCGHQVMYSDAHKTMRNELEARFREDGFVMPSIEDVAETYKNKKAARQMVEEMAGQGILVKVKYPYYLHHTCWDKAMEALREYKEASKDIVLGEFRDRLGISRKYAVLLLEGFDEQKLTRKTGDIRRCL